MKSTGSWLWKQKQVEFVQSVVFIAGPTVAFGGGLQRFHAAPCNRLAFALFDLLSRWQERQSMDRIRATIDRSHAVSYRCDVSKRLFTGVCGDTITNRQRFA
jgi:hypothetical protein